VGFRGFDFHGSDVGTRLLAGKSVLVVDDEVDLREILRFEFENLGAEVYEAENGIKAFELFQKFNPDVIISDVRMPGGDGLEFLRRVRKERDSQQLRCFLLMSAFADLSRESALKMGANELLPKPFNLEELRSLVVSCFSK